MERLFQRFVLADERTSRRFGGTGLGLALSRGFAQFVGGDVAVASIDGRGTTFTLRVPAVLRPAQEADGAILEELDPTSGNLVLVVYDEASQRDLIRHPFDCFAMRMSASLRRRAGF